MKESLEIQNSQLQDYIAPPETPDHWKKLHIITIGFGISQIALVLLMENIL